MSSNPHDHSARQIQGSEPHNHPQYNFPPPPPPPGHEENKHDQFPPPPHAAPGYPPPQFYPHPFYPPPVAQKLSDREPLPKNPTLYVKNLNTKIKAKYLKQALEIVFSQFGPLQEVHLKSNFRLRGQAFLIFDSSEAAEKAKNAMDGILFYHKPLMINYARRKSDIVTTNEGHEVPEEEKNRRKENDQKFKEWVEYIRNLRAQEKLNKLKHEQNELMAQSDRKGFDDFYDPGAQIGYPGMEQAGSSLMVRNLPPYMNQISLHGIFSHYPGFLELRVSPTKESATVYYNTPPEAQTALMGKSL